MPLDPAKVEIYHITHVDNLAGIIADGRLHSDAVMASRTSQAIGYSHIKTRRLTLNRVPCCDNRVVGDFVPFYYCPRSPMLFTINKGNTGRPPGCQKDVVHLVSTVSVAVAFGRPWAICNINAGVGYLDESNFSKDLAALGKLNWTAIRAKYWSEVGTQKAAEFLVADFFPWAGIQKIGCHNSSVAGTVRGLLASASHQTTVEVETNWYY